MDIQSSAKPNTVWKQMLGFNWPHAGLNDFVNMASAKLIPFFFIYQQQEPQIHLERKMQNERQRCLTLQLSQ